MAAELEEIDDAILDGGVIVPDETGRPQFYDLLRGSRKPTYVAFDLLWLKWYPPSVLAAQAPPASFGGHSAGRIRGHRAGARRPRPGTAAVRACAEHDLEGIVAKRLADPYEPGTRWLKIKNRDYSQKVGRGDLFNAG